MNVFGNIFAYIELAAGAVAAVGTIQHLVQAPGPVSGASLLATVGPVISGVETIFPKLVIPMDLITDIANGAADAINVYYKK